MIFTGQKKSPFTKILIIFLLIGCSPKVRYEVLSFFFDGVPNPSVVVDSLHKEDAMPGKAIASREIKPEFYYHPPYLKNECWKCHNKSGGNKPFMPLPELCYACHNAWDKIYPAVHGPVASGYCLKCHNQHQAKFPKLLLRQGQDLCLYCHDSKLVFQNIVHKKVGERFCTDCHNPHGGENKSMLMPGTCYNCHENFSNKYKTLHGPVASGYCTKCHGSHASKTAKFLLRENQQVCLYCHNQKQVMKNPAHKEIKKSNCTECHNPHGGEDRFILIQPAMASEINNQRLTTDNKQVRTNQLYLLNETGDTLMVAIKNKEGFFAFRKLPFNKEYTFLADASMKDPGEEIRIVFIEEGGREFLTTAVQDKRNHFRYLYLPEEKVKIFLMSEHGDTLLSATKNRDGNFLFRELLAGEEIRVVLAAADTATTEVKILYRDSTGRETTAVVTMSKDGYFRFTPLPLSVARGLPTSSAVGLTFVARSPKAMPGGGADKLPSRDTLMETVKTSVKPTRLFGQVYNRIPGDIPKGMEIMVLNDDGTLLTVTTTDSTGKFSTDDIPPLDRYTFKMKDDTANIKIAIPDNKKALSYVLEKDINGKFHFDKLGWQEADLALQSFSDTLLFTLPESSATWQKPNRLSGLVTGHISGNIHRELEIYALNDSREIVGVTRVYENGNFVFAKLPPYDNYLFIIKDENKLPVFNINTIFLCAKNDKEVRAVDKSNDGYFRYRYLPFRDLTIYALDEQKDTLLSAELNKDGMFLFGLLPEDTGMIFLLSGGAKAGNIEEMSVVVNGRMRLIKKGKDNLFRFVKLPAETIRLFLLDAGGDTLQTALVNDNGFFEFKSGSLYESEYFFLLDAGNAESIDEIQVVYTDEKGEEKIITPVKEKGAYFSYKKLPAPEAKLYLTGESRDTLDVAIMDENGYFTFKKLTPEGSYLFLLDSKDTGLIQDIKIHLAQDEGGISEITAARETGNLYKYKPLVHAVSVNRDLPDDAYVPVHLKKIEEKILSVASTHLEFNFGESVLRIPSYLYVECVNLLLIKHPDWSIVLSGHTDNIGSDAFNLDLSKKRAEAINKALVKRGIPAERTIVKYYGESMPVADNATPEGRKKNRRVEMAIVQNAVQQPVAQAAQDTVRDWKMSILSAGMHDIVFTILIMVSSESLALTPLNFNGIENVEELVEGGVRNYVAGISYDYDYASAVLLNEMRQAGFKDATVIALQNGKRIPVEEAIHLTNK